MASIIFMVVIVVLRIADQVYTNTIDLEEHYPLLLHVPTLNSAEIGGPFPPKALQLAPSLMHDDKRSVVELIHSIETLVTRERTQQMMIVISIFLLFLRLLKFWCVHSSTLHLEGLQI